jgi:hypothetical protein
MRNGGRSFRLLGVTSLATVLAYLAWRPRMLMWGATEEEATETLPGDDQNPRPRVQSTRAITIAAPPEQVWPWVVQMGHDRAGFYTHDWVERLFGVRYVDGHSATRIHPELQDLRVGDSVSYAPGVSSPVHELVPFKHLVTGEAFVLRPLIGGGTRLIVRYRGAGYLSAAGEGVAPDAPLPLRLFAFAVRTPPVGLMARGFDFFVADPLHHYMEVGMLNGIKERAEATPHVAPR